MRNMMMGLCVAVMMAGSNVAMAESKHWHDIDDVNVTKKNAVELPVDRPGVTLIRIVCTDGSVVINTLVVREGAKKTPHPIAKRIDKGDFEVIRIEDDTKVTGFRISHDGRGAYKVQVR